MSPCSWLGPLQRASVKEGAPGGWYEMPQEKSLASARFWRW